MLPSTRRSFLTATVLASAGCVSLTNNDSQLCDVGIVNQYDEPVEAELLIRNGDERVVEQTATLGPPPEGEGTGDGFFVQEEDLPTEPDQYVVRMRIANDEWETVDTTEYDDEQLLILGYITVLDESDAPSISIDPKQAHC